MQQLARPANISSGELQNENFRLAIEQYRDVLDAERRRRMLAEEEEEEAFRLKHPPRELLSGVESSLQTHGSGDLVYNKPTQKDIAGSSLKLG